MTGTFCLKTEALSRLPLTGQNPFFNFVKRKGSSTTKMTVEKFEAVKEQFILDIRAVVEMEDIPPELVFNWDQTGISIVPGSS